MTTKIPEIQTYLGYSPVSGGSCEVGRPQDGPQKMWPAPHRPGSHGPVGDTASLSELSGNLWCGGQEGQGESCTLGFCCLGNRSTEMWFVCHATQSSEVFHSGFKSRFA